MEMERKREREMFKFLPVYVMDERNLEQQRWDVRQKINPFYKPGRKCGCLSATDIHFTFVGVAR